MVCFSCRYLLLLPLSEVLLQHNSLQCSLRNEEPLLPAQAWWSPSSSVAQIYIQVPGHHGLNVMRQSLHGNVGVIVQVTLKWSDSRVEMFAFHTLCSHTTHALIFSICLWKLSPTLVFYWFWYYYINANAGFLACCLLFYDFLWSFVTVFDTDRLVQISADDHRLVETKFNIVSQNNTIWSIKIG